MISRAGLFYYIQFNISSQIRVHNGLRLIALCFHFRHKVELVACAV